MGLSSDNAVMVATHAFGSASTRRLVAIAGTGTVNRRSPREITKPIHSFGHASKASRHNSRCTGTNSEEDGILVHKVKHHFSDLNAVTVFCATIAQFVINTARL